MAAGSLKENDSLTATGEGVEAVMAHPQALVYVEVREEVVLVFEEMGLVEKPICEWLSPVEPQCGKQFTTRSVSDSCSYEPTILLDPGSMEDVCSKTVPGKATVAITSDLHMKANMTTPIVYPNGGTDLCFISQLKLHPLISLNLHGGGMLCTQVAGAYFLDLA